MLIAIITGMGVLVLHERSRKAPAAHRDRVTELALKQAKEALIAYATTHAVLTLDSPNGPGYFPCPDHDDDGDSDWNCGNHAGTTGQSRRLGRLPWKTLRLPDLRDSSGERLWYAVSSVYKNSTLKPGLNPDTGMGTITVRDSTGNIIHDGTSGDIYKAQAGGAVAVIIAPGSSLPRREVEGAVATIQDRSCGGGSCDGSGRCTSSPEALTAKCNPANYLDKATGESFANEDNARFVDANISRAGNADGFIQGPVYDGERALLVNDRLVIVTYDDIMHGMMQRVAAEAYHCLLEYTHNYADPVRPLNLGRYPFAAPACRSGYVNVNQWADSSGVLFGRLPVSGFARTRAASSDIMQDAWTVGTAHACSIASATFSPWFESWKSHVFFAVAHNHQPSTAAPADCSSGGCLQIVDLRGNTLAQNKQFAVLVSGPPLNISPPQDRVNANKRFPANYLEATNANLEAMNDIFATPECADLAVPASHPAVCSPLSSCNRITVGPRHETFNDLVMFFPP